MKNVVIIFSLLTILSSCGLREREEKLEAKEAELLKREQEMTLREQQLLLLRDSLNLKLQLVDSTKRTWDSVGIYNEALIGEWNVKMSCTETSCEGSAIGDTKIEHWTIEYENNKVVANAFSKKKLLRIYDGIYSNNVLKLTERQNASGTEISVDLTPDAKDVNKMKGTRRIVQPTCRILYSLEVDRIVPGKTITNILK